MRINSVDISNQQTLPELIRFLQPFCSQVIQALNNGLNFQDNMKNSRVAVKFPSNANQNIQIMHNLNTIPIGYVTSRLSAAAIVYDGNAAVLGATYANLKCNVAGITATIIFF